MVHLASPAFLGTAWLIRQSRDLVPILVGLAILEWLSTVNEEQAQELRCRRAGTGEPEHLKQIFRKLTA